MRQTPLDRIRSSAAIVPLLLPLLLLGGDGTPALAASNPERFPPSRFVVDVTQAPYFAKGDGRHDDTEALQAALNENVGRHRLLFFPRGTYLVSRTLTWPKRWQGVENWGHTYLRGESRDQTIIRLKDATFTDERQPAAILWCGGFGSADWFHNYVENLTFEAGRGNAGAVGLQFYSNNSGAVRHCRFVAADGSGLTGLDLGHRDMNGPLLVRDCEVLGFQTGLASSGAVNGQVIENLTLRGQRRVGLRNEGQHLSLRGLSSHNSVPALITYGTMVLLEARLAGIGDASRAPAVINYNGGRIFLRDVETSGYRRALADLQTPDAARAWSIVGEDRPGSLGPKIAEYSSEPATTPFPSAPASLRLPVKEPPVVPWDPPSSWANVDLFGADPTGREDSSAAIQRAMDSGAATVFLPGTYRIGTTVTIRGAVRRVTGVGGQISYGKDRGLGPDFRIEDGSPHQVALEHLAQVGGGVEIATRRTVIFRSVSDCDLVMAPSAEGGEIFAEDFVTHGLALRRQRMWARQLNVENEGAHVLNDGGELWVLGYKTERGGTLLHTRGGGRSEVLGGFSYTTTAGGLAPMFINEASRVWAFFGEVCYNNDPFTVLVREVRGTETRVVGRGAGNTVPYSGHPGRN